MSKQWTMVAIVLGGLALGSVALMPLAWFVLKPYQRDRLLVWLDPFRDPLGTAYNVIQAKIAIGSGQLLGKGIGGATQSRLAFLPAHMHEARQAGEGRVARLAEPKRPAQNDCFLALAAGPHAPARAHQQLGWLHRPSRCAG